MWPVEPAPATRPVVRFKINAATIRTEACISWVLVMGEGAVSGDDQRAVVVDAADEGGVEVNCQTAMFNRQVIQGQRCALG